MQDLALLEKIKDGDKEAFSIIMKRYKSPIFFMLIKMVQNPTDAEDLTMEIFSKAYFNLSRFVPRYKFSTWLFRIATNHGLDFLRLKHHRPNNFVEYDLKQVSHSFTPEEILLYKEQTEIIWENVNKLTPPLKEMTILYLNGWKYREIAERLNLPLGTVQSYLQRSRNKIKQQLL